MSSQDFCDSSNDLNENFDFTSYFNGLLETKKGVDVTFKLKTKDGEVEFFAHKLVLAMRSAYFADVFYGDQKDKKNKIIILKNIDPRAIKNMIRYCYGCKPDSEATEEICNLYKVAYQFKLMSLMNLCRKCLMDTKITPGNVFGMLKVSECVEDNVIRDMCVWVLEEKTRVVLNSYEMVQVTPAMVHIILLLPKLALHSEYELIKWLIDWANAKVKEGDTFCKNAREYLENLLQDMNFVALTSKEFALLCKDYPVFFTSEEIACVCLNIALPGTREMPHWLQIGSKKIRKYFGQELKTIDPASGPSSYLFLIGYVFGLISYYYLFV